VSERIAKVSFVPKYGLVGAAEVGSIMDHIFLSTGVKAPGTLEESADNVLSIFCELIITASAPGLPSSSSCAVVTFVQNW